MLVILAITGRRGLTHPHLMHIIYIIMLTMSTRRAIAIAGTVSPSAA